MQVNSQSESKSTYPNPVHILSAVLLCVSHLPMYISVHKNNPKNKEEKQEEEERQQRRMRRKCRVCLFCVWSFVLYMRYSALLLIFIFFFFASPLLLFEGLACAYLFITMFMLNTFTLKQTAATMAIK